MLLLHSFLAWAVLPALLVGLSVGLGLLVEHLARARLELALVAPIGAAVAIVLSLTGYVIGLRGMVTPFLVVGMATAGVVVSVRGGRVLPRPGLAAAVWLAAYGVYMAPVVLSGQWTWPGYNFVNDTSIQMLLAEWLPDHGRTPPESLNVSTTNDALVPYLNTGYPLGSHALLAAMDDLVPAPQAALYHPLVSTFAGLAAMALMALAQDFVGRYWAAFAAFAAVGTNLLYQYALQGNMKEIVTAALLATTTAVAASSLRSIKAVEERTARSRALATWAALLAIPAAGTINSLSTAGAPYAALIVLLWLGFLLAGRLIPDWRAMPRALAWGGGVLVVATLSTMSTLLTFGRVTSAVYAAPARLNELGHLAGPLEVRQTAGIWLTGDYRFPPGGAAATLTALGVALVVVLSAVAFVEMARRRNADALFLWIPVVAIMLIVTPRVSPYADAKTLMLMAPAVTLVAAVGAARLYRFSRALGWVTAGALLLGVMGSNALAYHRVQLAPIDRMEAMQDLDDRFAGEGLMLFNEPEEFAKNFMPKTRINVGAEAVTPKQTQLREPQSFAYLWFDLDDQTLEYVDQFPYIAFRRSPVASRPPAPFRRVYANAFYEVWRKTDRPQVVEHLPLQDVHAPAARPSCLDVRAMAARAEDGEVLLAAEPPTLVKLDTAKAHRSASWRLHPYRANMVLPGGPGEARAVARIVRPGRYRAWIAGSFGRPVHAFVDGRAVGSANGVNTVGQWHEVGTVRLTPGLHELRLKRGSGTLSPGDGFVGELGPLALERVERRSIRRVDPEDASTMLCGRPWDWIERVRR